MRDEVIDAPRADLALARKIYEMLFLVRRSEDYIIKYYHEDEMKTPMHMSMGQEAIPVGVCAALGDDGDIFSSYRSHAPFLAKTRDVDGFFAELYGRVTGVGAGKGGSMHLANIDQGHLCSTAIVASGIPVAVGTAFANMRLGTGRMTATFFGDGAIDEGNFWESLNAACVMRIPVLFVCEDNGLAVHTTKATRHGYRSIGDVVRRFDCVVAEDDSNDAQRIHDITAEAIARCRDERKPAFLRFGCYRYLEHVGINPDFDAGYRDKREYDAYLAKDCIALQRKRLLAEGASEADIEAIEAGIEAHVRAAVAKAKRAELPGADQLFVGVFHEKA